MEEVEEVEEVDELDELDAEDTGSPPPPHTPLLQTPSPQFSTHNSVASVFGAADFMAPVFETPAAPVFEEEEEDEEDLFLQQALALSMLPQQTASKEEKEVAPDVAPDVAVTEVPETPPPNSPPHSPPNSPPLSTLSVDAVAFAPMAAAAEATKDDKEAAKNEDTEIKQGDEAEETKVETKSIETKEEEAFSVAPFASFQEELLSKGITLERMMLWNRKDDEILMEWCR